jgi:hypothetical protein
VFNNAVASFIGGSGEANATAITFVRLFFDKAAESELKLNSSLSQQQRQNLFQGAYDASQFVQRSVVSVATDFSITGV